MTTDGATSKKLIRFAYFVVLVLAIWLVVELSTDHSLKTIYKVGIVREVNSDWRSTSIQWETIGSGNTPSSRDILCGSWSTQLSKGKTVLLVGELKDTWWSGKCLKVLAVVERDAIDPALSASAASVVSGGLDIVGRPSVEASGNGLTTVTVEHPLFSNSYSGPKTAEIGLPLSLCGTIPLPENSERVTITGWPDGRKNGNTTCFEWNSIEIQRHRE